MHCGTQTDRRMPEVQGKDTLGLLHGLLCATAVVAQGIKPAVLFCLKRRSRIAAWKRERPALVRRLNLCVVTLHERDDFLTLLFFDRALLETHMAQPDVRTFLQEHGYPPGGSLTQNLAHLRGRYQLDEYPHEIGVFLGYPLPDVRGFIENKGQNFKLCRYWKVYGDVQMCTRLFRQMDLARQQAVQALAAQA